jgi:hypothetical protein
LEERARALAFYDTPVFSKQIMDAKAEEPPAAAASAAGGKNGSKFNKNFDLTWKTDSSCRNVTFTHDNHAAVFNTNSSHRGIIAEQGFDSGCHEWSIHLITRPCCGFAGLALSAATCDSSYSSHFLDKDVCMGFSNFSGDRNAGNSAGTTIRIKLDIDGGTITYYHPTAPERTVPIPDHAIGQTIYPAVESDENGTYLMTLLDSSYWRGGGGDGALLPPLPSSGSAFLSAGETMVQDREQLDICLLDAMSNRSFTVRTVDESKHTVGWIFYPRQNCALQEGKVKKGQ